MAKEKKQDDETDRSFRQMKEEDKTMDKTILHKVKLSATYTIIQN